jgi:dienelactone hydrolase
MPRLLSILLLVVGLTLHVTSATHAADITDVLRKGDQLKDSRLGQQRVLRDKYHPWKPATTKAAWEKQSQQIRERALVSNGLWPLPPRTPMKPVIHGKIDRGDYTVEKVYFQSHHGHYVTGNLYRPKNVKGKKPGVLSPHGHWEDARFYDAGGSAATKALAQGGEKHSAAARHHIQARMVGLVRLGCVVFHYDMVGYSDSKQIGHRAGFTDAEAGLRLQNFMGLQTWNSIRALDFLTSLPDVDEKRIGVTGASGGGTQTFMLCAIDPRPSVAFPAVMVSTNMQGGCVCENAELLRIGINNIALAAAFAPKPMALSGAADWTIDIETRGLPELKQVYSLFGKTDLVNAKAYPQFGHNYNRVSRQMMYAWFARHLKIDLKGPINEEDFWPISAEALSVFDANHALPKSAKSSKALREYLTKLSNQQLVELLPTSKDELAEYRRVVGTAANVMLDTATPPQATKVEPIAALAGPKFKFGKEILHGPAGEKIPLARIKPLKNEMATVLWIDGGGKSHLFDDDGKPTAVVQKLLDAGLAVASADVFLTGEFVSAGQQPAYPKVSDTYQGYTFGYNRPVISNRVRDILTVLNFLRAGDDGEAKPVHLVGTGAAGKWVLLASAVDQGQGASTLVDLGDSGFEGVKTTSHPDYLPGALKYGGIGGLAALVAPGDLTVAGAKKISLRELIPLTKVYSLTPGKLSLQSGRLTPEVIVARLTK